MLVCMYYFELVVASVGGSCSKPRIFLGSWEHLNIFGNQSPERRSGNLSYWSGVGRRADCCYTVGPETF